MLDISIKFNKPHESQINDQLVDKRIKRVILDFMYHAYSYLNNGSIPEMFIAAVMLTSSAIRFEYPASLSYHA